MKKVHGHIIVDGQVVADTVQCCHCGNHWIPTPGSGKVRGYCVKCDALTCGAEECDPCQPFEHKLELFEKGKIDKL